MSEKQSLSMPNNVLGAPVSQVRAVRSVCKLVLRTLLPLSLVSVPASVLVNAKLGEVALSGLELTPYPGEGRRAASAVSAASARAVASSAAAVARLVAARASSTAAKEMTRSSFEDVVACAVAGVADAASSVRRIV